jgi:hypothetical protein
MPPLIDALRFDRLLIRRHVNERFGKMAINTTIRQARYLAEIRLPFGSWGLGFERFVGASA